MATKDVRIARDLGPKITGNIVTIMAGKGDGARVFRVQEDLVRSNSPFFEAALAGDWKEAATRTISLDEDDPKACELYIQWLYSGKICTAPVSASASRAITYEEEMRLVKAYCLGDKLQNLLFMDSVATAIMQAFQVSDTNGYTNGSVPSPGHETVNYIWANTPRDTPLRRLILDLHTWYPLEEDSRLTYKDYSQEFLIDLVRSMSKLRPYPREPGPRSYSEAPSRYCHPKKVKS
ncbi:MAG: hypothetical protein M1821_004638 [Bathelium mastoideum]|nr:MAG: hypothetical protein M1821_004638 [Bathelium mastoideum]KAI9688894.1 MAG: hypothetical protein M1822_001251 [Bathelium mastoideum]